MNLVSNEVDLGVEVISQSGEVFKRIKESAHYVVNQVEQFTSTTEEMSASSEEVHASFEEMANIASKAAFQIQELGTEVETQTKKMLELTNYADQLLEMSKELEWQVGKFKI